MNTNKLVLISFAFGVVASAGCSSTDVTASASGVFPAQGFTGRSLRVEVSGDQTKWKDGATVTFGDGVTVNSVTVASPTDLFADITVDAAAMAGMRDVTVTSGGTFKLSQAFELVSPVELVVQGNAGQGGLPSFTLINHDFDNPFDTTAGTTTAYANLTLTGPSGVQFFINNATEYTITGQAFIDLDAAAGPLSLSSGAGQKAITSNLGNFPVMPRTGTSFSGTATGMISTVGDSALFTLAATGTPSLVHITLSTSDQNAQLAGAIFTDNTWNHAVGLHAIMSGPGNVTFVVADVGTESGYTFTATGAGEMLTNAVEGNDTTNATNAGALAATALPFEQTNGSVSAATDIDEISFTVSAADVTANKNHLHLLTDAGSDVNTDTAVDIVNATGTSFLQAYGGGPVDGSDCSLFGCTSFGEDVVSDALAAGTYYVKVSAGQQWATTDKSYLAVMWLE